MTKQPQKRNSEQLTREIIHTANDLFARHGIEAVSMHQIAKSVGIGQGTLYRRYSNKSDLCMDMMKEHFNSYMDETNTRMQEMSHLPAKERLLYFFRHHITFLDQKSEWLQVIHARVCLAPEAPKPDFFSSPPYHYLYTTISGLLEEAKREGAAGSADPVLTAHSLIAALAPPFYLHLKRECNYTLDQIIERFSASILEPILSNR